MPKRVGFPVLVATDGSPQARAAVAAAVGFPWPRGARVHAVVARRGFAGTAVWAALDESLDRLRLATRRGLARRWPDADVVVVDQLPVEAIVSRARALRARAIVLGSRGHGLLGRLLLGSVSRGVVRRAACPVLVVKGRPRRVRRLVIGLDGSANSRRAVAFVAGLRPSPGARVTVLGVVEPVRVPSTGLLPPSLSAAVTAQAARLTERAVRAARREAASAARRLERTGWRVRVVVRRGVPLRELLRGATAGHADVLVVGARGVGGVERLLLGSVAEGALSRAAVSVLIVK